METTYLNVCDRPISRWSIVRLLKTVLLLLCVSFSSVYVQASDRSEGITISCKNESLEQVIHLIESQSSYLFVLNDKVNTKHKVSIKIENGNINAILNKIFQGTNMTYQVDGDHILISTTHKSIGLDETRQTIMIKGKIVDNAGEPMIGVNVLVKGTTNGAITDFEGNYSLADVNENDVLMVTYIGYLTQEVKVGKQSVINIVMKDDTQSLDEVVVVGYGVQKKSDLTGSISSIKPADITSTPTTNALKSLQGKVAGLDITQSSGQPGASISLTMRGNRSLKADNNPLVLVDGIDYGSFVDINPTDIESIEVLKDISSTAIYKDKNTVANLGVKSTSSVQADNDWRYTWENILNYSKTFGKHGLTAMIGSSTTAYGYEKVLASGANQASALTSFHDLGANADSKENASQLIETQMVSFFGRLNYKFNERYLFQASLRADGSSVLAKGHKWGYFPSASAAWRISEEGFMADQDIFSNLKLRLSWGVAGNSAIDAYATLGGLKKSVYTFGSSVYGYYPSEIANKDLTWEKTSTWNLGLDFSILRNRISGTIDTYISQTSDLLLPSLLPSSTGYASVMQNIGKTENKGIEVTLNTIWFQNENFSWNTDWTYSLNREKIKALNSGVTRDEGNLWFVGSPTQVFYDYKKIGIWQLGEEAQAKTFGGFKPGDIKVADMSPKGSEGEGVFSMDDRVIFSRVPKYTFGITNNITYKNFDLMFFIYGRIGQYVKDAYTQLYKPSALENSAPVNYWTPENPSNEYPRPNSGYSTNSYLLQSSLAFRKASFVKIRDITLGYTLPKEWTSKMMVQKLRIYCSLNNFITFTDFPNYDPESNGSMDFPLAKQVLFGINLSL